ncbi:hypothetical protein ACMD2_00537 [Ananas comosus]|uniref:Uncharacterized protein n=1 Tax=Ananas comosus TaxID=4615 RepID=A0A199UFL0_ANACO|nr:hypothetical protein ACMD2_00537 [Ananas comosus]
MNRRLRSPNRKPSSRIEERLHRFLRPGALARIRDSKMSAQSPRSIPVPHLSPPPSPPPSTPAAAAAAAQVDGVPCFSPRASGPRNPRRKKLAASKSVYFVPPSPEISDLFMDSFGSDLVAAH